MSSEGSSSTQGSKISKPEGCVEDGKGGCSGRVLVVAAVAFVPAPLDQDPLKRLPSSLICHSSQLLPPIGWDGLADVGAAAGVQMIPARHSHAARRPHNTSSDPFPLSLSLSLSLSPHLPPPSTPKHTLTHTHPAETWGPQPPLSHTRLSHEWLSKMETYSAKLHEHKRFQLNDPHFLDCIMDAKWAYANPLLGCNGGLNFLSQGHSLNSPPE